VTFRDVVDIRVQGGRGGDGAMSFLRLKYIPKGGPDGGHGGHGGAVLLRAVDDVGALARLIPGKVYKGGTGMQGEGRERHGKGGEDLILEVPTGTLARDLDSGEVVADLLTPGETVVAAKGGEGGRGNASFASSTRRTPRFAEYGAAGGARRLRLELRTIADAGLVGYPNAGKSSLLAALSNARPEVADYPFTTLTPHLGVVERGAGFGRLTLADVPGIIEGASEGKGLGLEFLRHIARTRLLVWVLDIAEEPLEAYQALRHEVGAYDPTLLELPGMIVLHKIDLAAADEVREAEHDLAATGLPVVPASALEGRGLDEVRSALFALLPERPELAPADRPAPVVTADPVRVERVEGGWRVAGAEAERLVERFDPRNADAVAYLQRHFEGLGLSKLLRRAGAEDGDDVWIGEAVFEYFDERREPADAADEQDPAPDGDGRPDDG
jgi:GTP-binding protein